MKGSHCGEHCWQEGKYMKNLQIGKSGIEVPFLGMGTWAIGGGAWWGDNDDSLSVKAIQTAASTTIPAGETTWGAVFIANGLQLIIAILLIVLGITIVVNSFKSYAKSEKNSEKASA